MITVVVSLMAGSVKRVFKPKVTSEEIYRSD